MKKLLEEFKAFIMRGNIIDFPYTRIFQRWRT